MGKSTPLFQASYYNREAGKWVSEDLSEDLTAEQVDAKILKASTIKCWVKDGKRKDVDEATVVLSAIVARAKALGKVLEVREAVDADRSDDIMVYATAPRKAGFNFLS